jgi:hypothetical protein
MRPTAKALTSVKKTNRHAKCNPIKGRIRVRSMDRSPSASGPGALAWESNHATTVARPWGLADAEDTALPPIY